MRKSILIAMAALLTGGVVTIHADNDYDDDIYFNPNKAQSDAKKKSKSNYIKNYSEIDVDQYNRRGQYYLTPVDTIGEATAAGEDFVYTQQIQKYINPTIVVDNADVLADVLNNSYGNVEIIIDNGTPYFAPCNYLTGPSFYYASAWTPAWAWGWPSWNWGWSWGPAWAYDPFWNIGWGWGPAWGFSWGGWIPGWGPAWGHSPGFYAHHYRPGANRRPTGPSGGLNWAANSRPGASDRIYAGNGRPGGGLSSRPGSSRPSAPSGGNTNSYSYTSAGHRIAPGVSVDRNTATGAVSTNNRYTGTSSRPAGAVDRNLTVNGYSNRSNRNSGTSNGRGSSYQSRTSNYGGIGLSSGYATSTYNNAGSSSTRSSGSSSRSYNSGSSSRSYNSGSSSRSSGGSFGGSRSSGGGSSRGGGGGGRHR